MEESPQLWKEYSNTLASSSIDKALFSINKNIDDTIEGAKREKVIEEAKWFLKIPYKTGGKNINGFDCSWFVNYIYKRVTQKILWVSSRDIYKKLHIYQIEASNTKSWDLVLFKNKQWIIDHVESVINYDANQKKFTSIGSAIVAEKKWDIAWVNERTRSLKNDRREYIFINTSHILKS